MSELSACQKSGWTASSDSCPEIRVLCTLCVVYYKLQRGPSRGYLQEFVIDIVFIQPFDMKSP